ncbi:unnamed protein product [Caenorhabditis bovis]|uniref:guanylate cyclase n=1 Tax=Caenorhabditis bovis TaxID=2654633 RepID=A0A8S1E8W3_9PELO|nr:unnamed protein product [Caenorhabditis bovis]
MYALSFNISHQNFAVVCGQPTLPSKQSDRSDSTVGSVAECVVGGAVWKCVAVMRAYLILRIVLLLIPFCDSADIGVTVLADDSIRNAQKILDSAKSEIQKTMPSVNIDCEIVATSCENADAQYSSTFLHNFYSKSHRMMMGRTCDLDEALLYELTKRINVIRMDIFNDEYRGFPPTLKMMSRSTFNIAENMLGLIRGFNWDEIGIVECRECYNDDVTASEKNMTRIIEILKENDISVKTNINLRRNEKRERIMERLLKLEKITRVLFLFLGNNLSDYLEFFQTFYSNNVSPADFRLIIVLSKYSNIERSYPWMIDGSLLPVFEHALLLVNDLYSSPVFGNLNSKFSFSSVDEAIVSLQIYEAFFVFAVYSLNDEIRDPIDFEIVVQKLSSLKIDGPYGEIYFNKEGYRIAPFKLLVVNISYANSNYLQKLADLTIDRSCSMNACVMFNADGYDFIAIDNEEACILNEDNCKNSWFSHKNIIYVAIGILAIIVIIIVYCFCQKLGNEKGSALPSSNRKDQKLKKPKKKVNENPWLINHEDIRRLDLNALEGSQHMSLQSLQKKLEESANSKTIKSKQIATIENRFVVIEKYLLREKMRMDRADTAKALQLKSAVQHDNINPFYGFAFDKPTSMYVIWIQCFRGSLADVVLSSDRTEINFLSSQIQGSFLRDILKGLDYLHNSVIGFHGSLTSYNCMVDAHWILKLSNFGVNNLLYKWKAADTISTIDNRPLIPSSELHYYAPEVRKHLKDLMMNPKLNPSVSPMIGKKADMYSFGMVFFDILFYQKAVHLEDAPLPECQIMNIADEALIPLRPDIPDKDYHPELITILQRCWSTTPRERPDTSLARKIIDAVLKLPGSLADQMMKNMDAYTGNLEKLVEERTADLKVEQQKADDLLMELLPKMIADQLKIGKTIRAETYESATILYSDIVGFTSLCSESQPMEVVELLSGMYQRFDLIISQQGGYKMETIGDAYCVAAGLPLASRTEHVRSIAMIALLQRDLLHQFEIPHRKGQYLNCRWGFNTGSVFSGVIGIRAPRYSCFGETVSVAAKMESSGVPDRIQMTLKSQQILASNYPEFAYSTRGTMKVEGHGNFLTYWLEGFKEEKTGSGKIKEFHTHINEQLSQIKRDSSMSLDSTMERLSAPTERSRAEEEARKIMTEIRENAIKSSTMDTPPSTTSSDATETSVSPIIRADSTLSTIPEL